MRHAGSWLVIVVVCAGGVAGRASAAAAQVVIAAPMSAGPPGAAQSPSTGDGVIMGRVLEAGTDRPIAGAIVSANSGASRTLADIGVAPSPPQSRTDSDGYFLFRDLRAGDYVVGAQAQGFVAGQYGQRRIDGPVRTVTLQAGQRTTNLVLRLARTGAIGGHVLDDAGDPVVGVQVRGLRRDGRGQLRIGSTAQTDDRGEYRLYGLTPGEYVLMIPQTVVSFPATVTDTLRDYDSPAVADLRRDLGPSALATFASEFVDAGGSQVVGSGLGSQSLLVKVGADGRGYGASTTFAPDAATAATAEVVTIASGQERTDVDIRLRFTPLFRVSGIATGPDGPLPNLGLRLLPATAARFQSDFGIDTAATAAGPDGRFAFLGIAPGEYEVRVMRSPRPPAQAPAPFDTVVTSTRGYSFYSGATGAAPLAKPPDGPTYWASQSVAVSGRDVDGVVVTLRPGARVSGRVQFDGQAPAAADLVRAGVSLVPADDRSPAQSLQSPIDDTGHFETAQAIPDRYVINTTGLPAGWTIAAAEAGGANLLEHALAIDAADVTDVVITVSQKKTGISGTVRGSGAGDPNAVVVVFPADYESWIAEGMTSRRVRTVDVSANGAYQVAGLTPGGYAVAAVPATADVDTRNPATIAALARVATRVTIALGEAKTLALDVSRLR